MVAQRWHPCCQLNSRDCLSAYSVYCCQTEAVYKYVLEPVYEPLLLVLL